MPKRIDTNHRAIVEALRAIGASVQSLANIGHGCPDLVVGFRGVNYLLEVKFEKGKVTEPEIDWLMCWQGSAHVVHSVDEAIEVLTRKNTMKGSLWFNYKTGEYERNSSPVDYSDYLPQDEATQMLHKLYILQGKPPSEAAYQVLVYAGGIDKKGLKI